MEDDLYFEPVFWLHPPRKTQNLPQKTQNLPRKIAFFCHRKS